MRNLIFASIAAFIFMVTAPMASAMHFHAHNGGSDISGIFVNAQYVPVALTSEAPGPGYTGYDHGGRYDTVNGMWTPVLVGEDAAPAVINGQVWFRNAANSHATIRVVRNDIYTDASIGAPICSKGPYADDYVCSISAQVHAEPGDTFRLYVYTTNVNMILDGNPLHSFFMGVRIRDS